MDNLIALALTLLLPFLWAHTQDTTQKNSSELAAQELPIEQPIQNNPSEALTSNQATPQDSGQPLSFWDNDTHGSGQELVVTEQIKQSNINQIQKQQEEIIALLHTQQQKLDEFIILQKNINTPKPTADTLIEDLNQHKLVIVTSLCIAWYIWQWLRILSYQKKLQSMSSWSFWEHDATAQELQSYNQEDLTAKLLLAIAHTYTNPHQPNDFVHPLLEFTAHIQDEIELVTKLVSTYKKLTRWHLAPLFAVNQSDITSLENRLEKLNFIFNIFSIWHMQADTSNL